MYYNVSMDTVTNIRLVGGAKSSNFHSGRVEVFINGEWGTVCDDSWSSNDARVVCRQLGYTSGTAYGRAVYGQGTGQIWLDDLICTGSESSLLNCRHAGIGSHNCGHGEDASVTCYNGECPTLAVWYAYSMFLSFLTNPMQSIMVLSD